MAPGFARANGTGAIVSQFTSADVIGPDLEAVVERGADDFEAFRGARLFVTGGTGFVGSWLLETFAHANRRLSLGARLLVLSRNPGAFSAASPHLASDPAIAFAAGDVRDARDVPGAFDAFVHAATSSSLGADLPEEEMRATVVDGTRSVLDLAQRSGDVPLLFTSSGAVYGKQPTDLERLDEGYADGSAGRLPASAYGEAKRTAEFLCLDAASDKGPRAKIARLFAFVGPYLPIDRHFAIGNFIADTLAGRTIVVTGDGTPLRTYLYAADLAAWLWRILARGEAGRAYNVGGERPYSIAQTARAVSAADGGAARVAIVGRPSGAPPERYVPDTTRARTELTLSESVSLETAVARTLAWHRARRATQS